MSDALLLWMIPTISALIGWLTNWMAVKMMFYPVRPFGWPPFFGWQGVVPANARKMAGIATDLIMSRLFNLEEAITRLDAERTYKVMARRLNQKVRYIVHKVMEESAPHAWAMLPLQGKEAIYKKVEQDLPNFVRDVLENAKHNADEIIDIKSMVIELLVENPELINEMFLTAGAKEFKFIEHSGLYFGFLFGIGTMLLWYYFEAWWILPAGGLLVGYATNVLALKIIFEPKVPRKLGPWTLQGLFLKRQHQVSKAYCRLIVERLVNAENLSRAVIQGPGSDRLFELIEIYVNHAIDKYIGLAQPYVVLGIGSENYYQLKHAACREIFKASPHYLMYAQDYANKAMNIEETLRDRMTALPPKEFEAVLRPAYQQDEWKLILVGAVLGMGAGFLQLYSLVP